MAYKKGRPSSKGIGDRKQRKTKRKQTPTAETNHLLEFDISNVDREDWFRLRDTVGQRRNVETSKVVGSPSTGGKLIIEVCTTRTAPNKVDGMIADLKAGVKRDIAHRIAERERSNTEATAEAQELAQL